VRVYEAIVKGLEGIGVQAAFGGAGENAASLMLALEDSKKIRPIMTRNEQAASFMACGYAMYTNRLGFCFATAGPGAFNLFSGLAVAMSDSYPVLAISGFSALEWRGKGALNETSGLNRTPDSHAMFEATTKKSWLLTDIADTCDVLEEAVNTAFEGRPGPVHIHVPVTLTHRGKEVENYHAIRLNVKQVPPDPGRVEAIASTLADALRRDKPIVALVGFGAIRSGAGPEIRQFIERFQIPLLTTLDGKGIVSENHPLSIGVFSDSGHSSAWKAFREARIVLAIGNAFNQHAADAKPAVAAITDALDKKVGPLPPRRVDGRDYEARRIPNLAGRLTKAIHPGQLSQAIGQMLPPNGILLADAGAHAAWLGYYVELEEGQNFRKPGEFGPMAVHVNGGIGVKVAHPDRTVVVGCGDGCYSLSGFELMTAVEHDIPVIWVIFNDREFKIIKLYQFTTYGETGLVEFQNPDFAAYARACGADGYRVEDLEDFKHVFAAALKSGRPTVIDAKITRWAIPHYSPSPDGVIAGLVETVEQRFRQD
jgi:acetolactate synthase-1/2/3 large subunit